MNKKIVVSNTNNLLRNEGTKGGETEETMQLYIKFILEALVA